MINFIVSALLLALTLQGSVKWNDGGRGVIGVLIDCKSGVISKVFKGSPAEEQGLQVNDKVYMVDNKPNNCVNIEGKPETPVEIWVMRGESPLFFQFIRIDSRSLPHFPKRDLD